MPEFPGIEIQVDTSDLNLVAKMLTRILHKMPGFIAKHAASAANETAGIMKALTPRRTGRTASTIKVTALSDATWHVGSDDENFLRLLYGTKPHPIYPRYKKALWWEDLPRPISHVPMHPGQAPLELLQQSANEAERLGVFAGAANWVIRDTEFEWHL